MGELELPISNNWKDFFPNNKQLILHALKHYRKHREPEQYEKMIAIDKALEHCIETLEHDAIPDLSETQYKPSDSKTTQQIPKLDTIPHFCLQK